MIYLLYVMYLFIFYSNGSPSFSLSSGSSGISRFAIRFMTDWGIPGWATSGLGFSVVIFLQSATFAAIAIFSMLSNRSMHSEPPLSFYKKYITHHKKVY